LDLDRLKGDLDRAGHGRSNRSGEAGSQKRKAGITPGLFRLASHVPPLAIARDLRGGSCPAWSGHAVGVSTSPL